MVETRDLLPRYFYAILYQQVVLYGIGYDVARQEIPTTFSTECYRVFHFRLIAQISHRTSADIHIADIE